MVTGHNGHGPSSIPRWYATIICILMPWTHIIPLACFLLHWKRLGRLRAGPTECFSSSSASRRSTAALHTRTFLDMATTANRISGGCFLRHSFKTRSYKSPKCLRHHNGVFARKVHYTSSSSYLPTDDSMEPTSFAVKAPIHNVYVFVAPPAAGPIAHVPQAPSNANSASLLTSWTAHRPIA